MIWWRVILSTYGECECFGCWSELLVPKCLVSGDGCGISSKGICFDGGKGDRVRF